MYISYNSTTYDKIRRLVFSPEVNAVSNELIVNDFSVDLVTDDTFEVGNEISLYDDSDTLWAHYWISFAEKTDSGTVRITARSILYLLDRKTLPAVMYNDDSAATVISGLFSDYGGSNMYELDNVFGAVTLRGYCPEQTARERLHWICFTIGAYINTCFSAKLQILQVDVTSDLIPANKTFWRPTVAYNDYVTAIKVVSYEYTIGTPLVTDRWVEVNGTTYIEQSYEHYINNPDVPVGTPDNVLEISDLTIVNESNYNTLLANLAVYYFARLEVTAEILDDGEFKPGNIYTVDTGFMLVSGFMRSADFAFGQGTKARVSIVQALERASGIVTIRYMLNGSTEIDKNEFRYPLQTHYSVPNPWLDRWIFAATVRRIYYPVNADAEGNVLQPYVTNDQTYYIAAQHNITSQTVTLENIDNAVLDASEVLWIE